MRVSCLLLLCLAFPLVAQPNCTIKKFGNMVELKIGDHAVGRYLFDPSQHRPHFHPLFSKEGKSITRAYPMVKDVPGETKDQHPSQGVLGRASDCDAAEAWGGEADQCQLLG